MHGSNHHSTYLYHLGKFTTCTTSYEKSTEAYATILYTIDKGGERDWKWKLQGTGFVLRLVFLPLACVSMAYPGFEGGGARVGACKI